MDGEVIHRAAAGQNARGDHRGGEIRAGHLLAVFKGVAADGFQRRAVVEGLQALAAGEGPLADAGDALGEADPGQRLAAVESAIGERHQIPAAEGSAGETAAAREGEVTQLLQIRREHDAHQRVAAEEGALADPLHMVLEIRQRQAAAAGEGTVADLQQGVGQIDPLQSAAALEGVVADAPDTLRHVDALQADHALEAAVADLGDGLAVDLGGDGEICGLSGVTGESQTVFSGGVAIIAAGGEGCGAETHHQRQNAQDGQEPLQTLMFHDFLLLVFLDIVHHIIKLCALPSQIQKNTEIYCRSHPAGGSILLKNVL